MIYDKLEYANNYASMPNLKEGLKVLTETDFASMEDGKYEVSENVFFMITSYQTKPANECKPESHKKYIDIQYALRGSEGVPYASLSAMGEPSESYPEKDLYFYITDNTVELPLQAGYFMVLYPHDVHAPGVKIGDGCEIRKVVVKVRICD